MSANDRVVNDRANDRAQGPAVVFTDGRPAVAMCGQWRIASRLCQYSAVENSTRGRAAVPIINKNKNGKFNIYNNCNSNCYTSPTTGGG